MPEVDWELAFVLPNLSLPAPSSNEAGDGSGGDWSGGISLGQDCMAIVAEADSRVRTIMEAVPAARRLLNGFRTPGGHAHKPSALIIRTDTPAAIKNDLEAIVSFRNAVAFSFILRARAAGVKSDSPGEPSWSDTFDFHPTVIGQRGHLVTVSDALQAIFAGDATFHATHSPNISPCGRRLYPDFYLLRALGKLWNHRYRHGLRGSPYTRAVFRSLEVAFGASSAAAKNQGSLSDYGTQMALWVSAIEILAWPEDRRADFGKVHRLLGRYQWASDVLNRARYQFTWGGNPIKCNAVQRAYGYMYRARNRFLHGETVTAQTLVPRRLRRAIPLPQLAAIVYRTALAAFLEKRIEPERPDAGSFGKEFVDEMMYSQAIKRGFGLASRRHAV
jgi:hypothetical protein